MGEEKSIRNSIVIGGNVTNSQVNNNASTTLVAVSDALKILDQLDAEVPNITEAYLHAVVREKIDAARQMIQQPAPPKDRLQETVDFLGGVFKSAGVTVGLISNLRTAFGV